MTSATWGLRSRRVVTPTGTRAATVLIQAGVIVAVVDAPDQMDPSIRSRIMGTWSSCRDWWTATSTSTTPAGPTGKGSRRQRQAAAAGGITTLVDMPLNSSPVTTTPAALDAKRVAARGRLRVDCGFYGGLVPGNADQIEPLADAGVVGFKAFLSHSGIDEFPNVGEADLRPGDADPGPPRAALARPCRDRPAPAPPGWTRANPASYAAWLASRPECVRGRGDPPPDPPLPGDRLPRPDRPPRGRVGAAADRSRAGRGVAADGRGLPALPDLRRRGDPRRRPPVQVRPADPVGRQPRGALGRAPVGPDRHDRDRPLPRPAGLEAPRLGRPRRGLGRDLVAPARLARRLDRGPRPRVRPADVARWMAAGAGRAGRPGRAEGGDRGGGRRRLRRPRPRRRFRRRPRRRSTTATPRPLTTGGPCSGGSSPLTSAASGSHRWRSMATRQGGSSASAWTGSTPGAEARRPPCSAAAARGAGPSEWRRPAVRLRGDLADAADAGWDGSTPPTASKRSPLIPGSATSPPSARSSPPPPPGPSASNRAAPPRRTRPLPSPRRGERRLRGPVRPHLHRLRHRQDGRRDARPAPQPARQRPGGRATVAAGEQAQITRLRLESSSMMQPDHDPRPRPDHRPARPRASPSPWRS